MTKIACMSDFHGMWHGLSYPSADILVVAGDIFKNFSRDRDHDAIRQLSSLDELNNHFYWLKNEGIYKEIIVVAGNHDFVFERQNKLARERIDSFIYLQDEAVEIDGLKFYGSPHQPWFFDWAFNFPNHHENFFRSRAHAQTIWDMIPGDTEVLITHGPPLYILDTCYDGRQVGCQYLKEKLQQLVHLKLHVFGHIHHSHGEEQISRTKFVNASICTEAYKPTHPIRVVEI